MIPMKFKTTYWHLLRKWRRLCHPQSRSYSPHPWMEAIGKHIPDDTNRIIMIDGGAHTGMMAKQFYNRFPNLEVHAFEPNTDLIPTLQTNLDDLPGSCNVMALGSQTRTDEFIVNDSPMTSSLLPRNELGRKYFDHVTRPRETRGIQVITLDDWFDRSGLDRIDLIKLDLQGYEAEALQGATRVLDLGVACLFLEVHFIPFYKGCSLFAEVDTILRRHGYQLYNLYNLCTHLPEGQIGSADAIYIPRKQEKTRQFKEAA